MRIDTAFRLVRTRRVDDFDVRTRARSFLLPLGGVCHDCFHFNDGIVEGRGGSLDKELGVR